MKSRKDDTMGQISVESYMSGYLITHDDGRDILIQSDWDFCGVASSFGWRPENKEECDWDTSECEFCALKEECEDGKFVSCQCWQFGTDGTVECPNCHKTASEFISDAAAFLDDSPDSVEDPGYFGDED